MAQIFNGDHRCGPNTTVSKNTFSHAGNHHRPAMIRMAVGEAGSMTSQVRMRSWSSQKRRVFMTRVVSVAVVWQRTDSSSGTKQTVERSIKRSQRSKSTS